MTDLQQMMKQAQEMQTKMVEMQEQLGQREIEADAGGGMVRVTLNGKAEMKRIMIDRTLLDPTQGEMIEDLIVAAFNNAKNKVEETIAEEMSKLTAGMEMPDGFKMPV